jgi:hypothetical protein
MIHRMLSAGTVPAATSFSKFCTHKSTRHLSGMPRSNCGKDRDCQEVVPHRPLAIGKDGPGGHRKLVTAGAAFPQLTGRVCVDLGAAALRTIGFAPVIGPPNLDEFGMRFLIRHARNGAQGERPCGCGEEEVLRHHQYRWVIPSNMEVDCCLVNSNITEYDGATHRNRRFNEDGARLASSS